MYNIDRVGENVNSTSHEDAPFNTDRKGFHVMKKARIIISILAILFVVLAVCVVLKDLWNDGWAYYGDVWQSSPEKALQQAADRDSETMQTLTPKIRFKELAIDDIIVMTFLSQNDTLVTVTLVSNEKNQYSVYGWTEEYDLDHPSNFLIDGDADQFILFPYEKYHNIVLGWCYSTAQFTVNGISPERETFTFDLQGKTYSIDFWTVNGQFSDDGISIEYSK